MAILRIHHRASWLRFLIGGAVTLVCLIPGTGARAQGPKIPIPSNATVVASGLHEPRGLRFGPDGNLYVAEAGSSGTNSVASSLTWTAYNQPCFHGGLFGTRPSSGFSGRISMFDAAGKRTTVVDNLPSSGPAATAVGIADILFVHGVMYGLLNGGCSFGQRDMPAGIIQIAPDGTWSEFDLSTWTAAHPPAQPDPEDYTPDGSWFSMTSADGKLYTANANGGQIVELTPNTATFRELVDVSASKGHVVPDAITYHDGNFYVAEEGTFDANALNNEDILQITPSGDVSVYASGLNKPAALAFDSAGNLYALELLTGSPAPGPSAIGTGMVVKVTPGTAPKPVVTNLTFPTGMTFGPDGNLYVSNVGFGIPGSGQILKVNLSGS